MQLSREYGARWQGCQPNLSSNFGTTLLHLKLDFRALTIPFDHMQPQRRNARARMRFATEALRRNSVRRIVQKTFQKGETYAVEGRRQRSDGFAWTGGLRPQARQRSDLPALAAGWTPVVRKALCGVGAVVARAATDLTMPPCTCALDTRLTSCCSVRQPPLSFQARDRRFLAFRY